MNVTWVYFWIILLYGKMNYKLNEFKILYLKLFSAMEHITIPAVISIKLTVYILQVTDDSSNLGCSMRNVL